MRNGPVHRGGREKRFLGQMNKAMDRTPESVLHRVRGQTGNERINSHSRGIPSGPRAGNRAGRVANGRTASLQAGLANMAGGMNGPGSAGMPAMGDWGMMGAQAPMDIYAMFEQQAKMMQQLSEQVMNNSPGLPRGGYRGNARQGRPLSERVNDTQRNNRGRGAHHQGRTDFSKLDVTDDDDMDMDQPRRELPNPDETICKYNQNCTNKDCKFAHASPAAPRGASVDVGDVCTFGVACKNRKCVGRHPSPATKMAHQSEQECKFFPNCQNPRCTFKHPSMPPCRNGGECSTPDCKFTHVKTKCKFSPCLNPQCPFSHEEGQRGSYKDKVWTADQTKEHPSERKFVDETAEEEVIVPGHEHDGIETLVQV